MGKFGWSLPPGAANDPAAPYNQPDPPACPECEHPIADGDDHEDGCPMEGDTPEDLADYYAEQRAPNADSYKEDQMEP